MAAPQKLVCAIDRIVDHGERVYTVALRPERDAPRFRAGQVLHLALDPYDPSGFWPESRVFSIASSPSQRDLLRITYAVHGRYTARMEAELVEGGQVWIKMPYGDFVIDSPSDVVLLAGGTGISAFTSYIEELDGAADRACVLAYGARTSDLLIYRDLVERTAARAPALDVSYFVEQDRDAKAPEGSHGKWHAGRVSVDALWPHLARPLASDYYIAGPPAMLRDIGSALRARSVRSEAIHIDAWE
jgi:ferredoxin-NADP reductase